MSLFKSHNKSGINEWEISHQLLKRAKIVPPYKKSDPKSVLNYRFISILNTISKVIEKCIANRMVDYLEKKIQTESQHGYRPGKST